MSTYTRRPFLSRPMRKTLRQALRQPSSSPSVFFSFSFSFQVGLFRGRRSRGDRPTVVVRGSGLCPCSRRLTIFTMFASLTERHELHQIRRARIKRDAEGGLGTASTGPTRVHIWANAFPIYEQWIPHIWASDSPYIGSRVLHIWTV